MEQNLQISLPRLLTVSTKWSLQKPIQVLILILFTMFNSQSISIFLPVCHFVTASMKTSVIFGSILQGV